MNRPIEFRQRVGDTWHYWGIIDGLFIGPMHEKGVLCGENQQFTGLFDKNGKKIFEGDIVSDDGQSVVVERNAFTGFSPFVEYFSTEGLPDFEVIGNVFENPNLLTHD